MPARGKGGCLRYELVVRVEVRQTEGSYSGGGLNVNESFPFDAVNFAELCRVLTKFHDLAEEIRQVSAGQRGKH